MTRARLCIYVALVLCLSGAAPAALVAGSDDDARNYWQARYDEAMRNLQTGSAEERARAAMLLGAHRQYEFVRPLANELLRELDDPAKRSTPINDPYVKTAMAWALGEIAHPISVGPLVKALEISRKIVGEQIQQATERQTRERQRLEQLHQANANEFLVGTVNLSPDRPAPFNQPGFSFGYSPDMMYSVSDSFKSMDPDVNDEGHRLRLQNYNYLNLTRQIFLSLGNIGSEDSVQALAGFLKDEIPMIRYMAAAALGRSRSQRALAEINARFNEESDPYVKVGLSYGGLTIDKSQAPLFMNLLAALKSDDTYVRYHAAAALRELGLGESVESLRAARLIESEPQIQGILDEAIVKAEIDNIIPVNY
ncbi:MAG: HEAT repeat domain-containing protein [Leptospirales bacterium]|nr:HEAT repeat domain-containing protein [Leptospirales bacterium]